MILELDDHHVTIAGSGIPFLTLKAKLHERLKGSIVEEKGRVSFSRASLGIVADLLPSEFLSNQNIVAAIEPINAHAQARERVLEIVEGNVSLGVSDEWLNRLDPAQAVAVAGMVVPGLYGLCLFDEQGSGKTVMTIAAFDILMEQKVVDAMIVVCPKTMLSAWPNDLEKFLPGKYKVTVADGNPAERFDKALENFDLLLTNFEGVQHIYTGIKALSGSKKFLLVVDESFFVKNPDAQRAEAATKLRSCCMKCYVLCGTPAPNSAYDLINQFDMADTGYTFGSFSKSKDENFDTDKIVELVDTRGTYIRRLKTDILSDIPDKNFHIEHVQLTGKQADMYEKARTDLLLELRGLDNKTFKKKLASYFQKRAALLQICANPASIDPTMTDEAAKLKALDALISRLISAGRKVIVWSFYKKSIEEVCERYKKYSPLRVDGSVDTKSRNDAVLAFQNDPGRMLFVANPAAAGAGITLHAAYDAIYLSYSNQAAHYLQSLDRIHRRGQKSKEVNYYLLVCRNTIEETEVRRLREKELHQHSLLGDQITWPSDLDDALSELSHPIT
ncbi:MAG: DEAD/DEAH box helicase [Alphaproteobacteria bacterium]|nr:DEAD/DEAH box helicase [Alphaproteobacteria bacterium]